MIFGKKTKQSQKLAIGKCVQAVTKILICKRTETVTKLGLVLENPTNYWIQQEYQRQLRSKSEKQSKRTQQNKHSLVTSCERKGLSVTL